MDIFKIVTSLIYKQELSEEDKAALDDDKTSRKSLHMDAVAEGELYFLLKNETEDSSDSYGIYNVSSYSGNANLNDGLQRGEFILPVRGTISKSQHSGYKAIDFATSAGTPIHAVANGVVIQAEFVTHKDGSASYGNCIRIDHGNRYVTLYAHCQELMVSVGQTVSQGQQIATVGSTGNSSGPHLHFEIRYNGVTVEPKDYLIL